MKENAGRINKVSLKGKSHLIFSSATKAREKPLKSSFQQNKIPLQYHHDKTEANL